MKTLISGQFSDTPLGRSLKHLAAVATTAALDGRFEQAISACLHAEKLTQDRQWPNVRKTLECVVFCGRLSPVHIENIQKQADSAQSGKKSRKSPN